MNCKRNFFCFLIIAIVMFSLSPAFAQLQPGWKYLRYDLNGSNYFPFPSTVQTDNKYNLNWTAAIGLSQPGRPILTGDVNGDGYLEIVHVVHSNMKIFDMDGNVLKQVTLGSKDCVLSFLADFDEDGIEDIFIQTGNDPQMKIYIYDGNGNLLSTIAKSSSGDPDICAWAFLPNGKLIVSYKGRTGNNSRGLACWLYDFNTKRWSEEEKWYYSIGPAYSDVSIANADQDSKYEITLSTVASSLGDVGTGNNNIGTHTYDDQIYTVVVDEDGNEEFTLKYGGVKAFLYNYFADFDHDGKYEILAVECHGSFMGSFPGTSKLHIIDYDSLTITNTFNGAENAHWAVAFADVNGDGIDEIIASNIQTGSFTRQYILNSNLNILKSADIAGYVTSINDINGDGKLEIVLKDESIIKILDNELNLLWNQQPSGKIYHAIFSDLDKNGRNELLVTGDKLFNFEGEPLPPNIEVNPDSIAFDNVLINNTTSSMLYIKNVGQGLLNVSNITNNDYVFIANPRSGAIPAGDSLAITISFTPTSEGRFQDNLHIFSNDQDEPIVDVPLSGWGEIPVGPPIIVVEPSPFDFGNVYIGKTKLGTLFIKNVGQELLIITNITNKNTIFTANPRFTTIQASDSAAITLSFTPTSGDFYQDNFYIHSNDPVKPIDTVFVSGTGVIEPKPIIFLPNTSHNFQEVPVLTSKSWDMRIENRGDTALVVYDIESDNSVFTVSSPKQFEVAPYSSSYQVQVKFNPINIELETGTLTITSNDPIYPQKYVSLTGKGIDNQPPEIMPEPITQQIWLNSDCPITARVTDNWKVSSVLLSYRKGSGRNFNNITMNMVGNDIYRATIPASETTYEGIAYFIQAKDSAGNMNSTNTFSHKIYFPDEAFTTSGPNSYYSNGFPRGQWNMISIPAVLENQNVSSVLNDETELGSYGEPNWRLFSYEDSDNNGVTDSYIEYDVNQPSSMFQFTSGKAFWLKANPDGSKIAIDVGAGYVLPLQPQTISLKPGWNQIGNPFAFPITFSPNDLNIVNQLYLTDGAGGYQLTTTMQPWTGYFTYVNGNNNVDLALSPSLSNSLQKDYAVSGEWVMQIATYCGDCKDEINYLGISQVSSDNYDEKDLPEPPAIGDHISFYFSHPDWQQRCKQYTSDFRLNMKNGQVWNFEVTTNQNSPEVTLKWEMIQAVQPDLKFIFYDINRAQSIDMKFISQYRFSRMNKQATSRFKIIVGNSHFIEDQLNQIRSQVPSKFCLYQNYPNPFNAATTVRFDISRKTNVKFTLYNIRGEEIKVIIDRIYEAGRHEITFNAANLPSGMFFYKIEADGFVAVKKFIVLK